MYVFPIRAEREDARCPNCHRRFRVLTRFVTEARKRIDGARYFYDFLSVEEGGRERMRSQLVSRDTKIQPRSWVTFVWRGERLIGIADQQDGYWFPVNFAPRPPRFRRLTRLLLAACGLLIVLQALSLLDSAQALIADAPQALLVLLALLAIFLAPLALWALEALSAEEDEDEIVDPFADWE